MRQCKDSSVFSTFWLALVSHSKAKGTSTKEVYVNFPIISFEVLVANPLPLIMVFVRVLIYKPYKFGQ